MLMSIIGLIVGVVAAPALPASASPTTHDRLVSADPANFTPNVLDGRVHTIVQVGTRMIAGGEFTQVRASGSTTTVARQNIFAFDATTGAIDTSFVPVVDGRVEAIAIAPDNQSVYITGSFNTVNGVRSKSVERIDVTTGASVAGFTVPPMNGVVRDTALHNGRLFIGGQFTTLGGVTRPALATLNPQTGALDGYLDLGVSGVHNGGATSVAKLDIAPDGSRMVLIGNFNAVGGQQRNQIATADLAAGTATLSDWSTTRYQPACAAGAFDTYMRDVDISPDSSFFVVATTGAPFGGTLCDTAARWELKRSGPEQQPSWVDSSGGDTLTAVEIVGPIVYVGGHQRWMNNPFAGDSAGPGAVSRPGLVALDPVNGLPFSWNPGRDRGVAVYDFLATPTGLWFTSDTRRVAGELRERLAFFPLAGGKALPSTSTGTLPGDVYLGGVPGGGSPDDLLRRQFDGSSAGPTSTGPDTGVAWSQARGAVMIGDVVYTGWSDGELYRRTFDGASFGAATVVNTSDQLNRLQAWHDVIPSIQGMYFADGRLYYTVSGRAALSYRYFEPESGIVGAQEFEAVGNLPDLDWRTVGGMVVSGGKLYAAHTGTGSLRRVDLAGGVPVGGTVTTVSGPDVDGVDWRGRAVFLFAGPANQAPTASFTSSCSGLSCAFDGSGSSDPDGSVRGYAWTFGDGTTGTGVTTSHAYGVAGTYPVGLTVTDNRGGTATTTRQVTVAEPTVSRIAFVGGARSNSSNVNQTVTVPTAVQPGDAMLLALSYNSTSSPTPPTGVTGWAVVGTQVNGPMSTVVYQKSAAAGDAGRTVTINLGTAGKADLQLLAYTGTRAGTPVAAFAAAADTTTKTSHTTPTVDVATAGSWVVSYWADRSSTASTDWTAPAGQTVRLESIGAGGGRIDSLSTDAGDQVPTGPYGGLTATTDTAGGRATMWTIVLAPVA